MASFDQAQSPRLGQRTTVESTTVTMFNGADIPEASWDGRMIYRPDLQELQIYRMATGAYENVTGGVSGQLTFVGPSEPIAQNVGDLWFDSANGHLLHRWDGATWANVQDAAIGAAHDLAVTANNIAVIANNLAVTKKRIFNEASSTTGLYPASNPVMTTDNIGDTWFRTDAGNEVYNWSGTAWISVQDTSIATAHDIAVIANDIAVSKKRVFAEAAAAGFLYPASNPVMTTDNVGDTWFRADEGNAVYTWTGTVWKKLILTTEAIQPSDGLPPSGSPVATVTGGFGQLFITWPTVTNADLVIYEIYVGTTSSFPVDVSHKFGETAGTMATVKTYADGTVIPFNVDTYARIVAKDVDGSASPGVYGVGQVKQLVTSDITPGAITTSTVADFALSVVKFKSTKHEMY